MHLLDVIGIKKYYGTKEVLKGVSFSLDEGEVFSLLGANGAGKTTLSSIIVTLCPPASGDVKFRGSSIYSDITGYRNHIGYCPQASNLHRMLTMEDNLLQAGRYYGMKERMLKQRFEELVEQFSLHEYIKCKPFMLSGGYRQRFLIARSLMHSPSIVVFDEPTVGLDPHIRRDLWEVIKGLKKQNVTVLLTTHYLDEAEYLSDRVCILDHGEILMVDLPDNLKKQYNKDRLEDVFIQLMRERGRR